MSYQVILYIFFKQNSLKNVKNIHIYTLDLTGFFSASKFVRKIK